MPDSAINGFKIDTSSPAPERAGKLTDSNFVSGLETASYSSKVDVE